MNIPSHRSIEMPAYREYRDSPKAAGPDAAPTAASEVGSAEDALSVFGQPAQPNNRIPPAWVESVQQINQKGWVGFALRWVPIVALCVTIMGGVFAYMNHKALDAQRTLNLVKKLQPILAEAHRTILAAVQNVQATLAGKSSGGTNTTSADGP